MKLMVQSYNTEAINKEWNDEFEETAFRSYTIDHQFNRPAKAVVTLADPSGALMRKYTGMKKNVAGAVADDGGVETDETTAASEDTADDMTLWPAVPAVNDAYCIAFDNADVAAFEINVTTIAVYPGAVPADVWEYSQGGDVWASCVGVTDQTNTYTESGWNAVRWTPQGDWATDTVGGISGKYWIRNRLTALNGGWTTVPKAGQARVGETYLGPSKVTIEDPDATDIFYGRITKVQGSFQEKKLYLTCEDWLSQLDEEHITYDMREDLDGSGLRQSALSAVPDYDIYSAYTDGTPDEWLFDNDMAWAADQWRRQGPLLLVLGHMLPLVLLQT
jgi:hypothetical protein